MSEEKVQDRDCRDSTGLRHLVTSVVVIGWLLLVNGLFFWHRIADSNVIKALLDKLRAG